MADAVSVGLDRFAVDVSGSEGFEERVEADDGERVIRPVPARAESGSINKKGGVLVDLPGDLVPGDGHHRRPLAERLRESDSGAGLERPVSRRADSVAPNGIEL